MKMIVQYTPNRIPEKSHIGVTKLSHAENDWSKHNLTVSSVSIKLWLHKLRLHTLCFPLDWGSFSTASGMGYLG